MKRMFKIGWIVLIVGLVAVLIGYFNHGDRSVEVVNGRPQIQRHGNWELTRRSFKSVDLDIATDDVTIRQGDRFQVHYQGQTNHRPTVSVQGHRLVIKQTATGADHVSLFSGGAFSDHLTITVPRGTVINGGRIKLTDGDLAVTGVDLKDVQLKNTSGDISLSNLQLANGQARLTDGDFDADQLRVQGHYRVDNASGDNDVHGDQIGACRLYSADGDNEVNGHDRDQDSVDVGDLSSTNVLELNAQDGDNSYFE